MAEPLNSSLPSVDAGVSALNDVDSRLAYELAVQLSPAADVMARYGISEKELKAKLANPQFRQMIKEARATWNSDLSVKERIRVKSMMLVEDSLLELHKIFHNTDLAVGARMDAFKNMSKVAAVDTPDREGNETGNRVVVNISIPGAEKPVTYEGIADAREEIADSA